MTVYYTILRKIESFIVSNSIEHFMAFDNVEAHSKAHIVFTTTFIITLNCQFQTAFRCAGWVYVVICLLMQRLTRNDYNSMNLFTHFEFADDDNDDTKINQARNYFVIDSNLLFFLRAPSSLLFLSHLFYLPRISQIYFIIECIKYRNFSYLGLFSWQKLCNEHENAELNEWKFVLCIGIGYPSAWVISVNHRRMT